MKFFKLDTGVTKNFGTVLGDDLDVFSTKMLQVISTLIRERGAFGAIKAILRAVTGQSGAATSVVDGNVARKQIRLPAIFDNWLVGGFYRRVKMFEAGLLYQALGDRLSADKPDVAIIYNGSNSPESIIDQLARERKLRRVYVEAGFFPKTLQIDAIGLNGANSLPSDPQFYLDIPEDLASLGIPTTVNNRQSKRTGSDVKNLEPGYVFVPFQVPSDMQVTLHSPWVRNMEMFLDVVYGAAQRNQDDVFVIKEHPSFKRSVVGLREKHPRIIFANDNVTSELIENARAVVTLNSTVGIESLLFEKPVITLGRACYNIKGLVKHVTDDKTLDRALIESRNWTPDPVLRRQFIGYLWNRYLTHGTYNDPPQDLGNRLADISAMHVAQTNRSPEGISKG